MQENIPRKRLNLCRQTRTGPWQSSASPQVISRHTPHAEIDKNSLGAFVHVCARVSVVRTGPPIRLPSGYVTQGCERSPEGPDGMFHNFVGFISHIHIRGSYIDNSFKLEGDLMNILSMWTCFFPQFLFFSIFFILI